MAKEIINRVANSVLITIDLEDFYPTEPRIQLDIEPWLFKGLILKEKDFRASLNNHNWEQYQNCHVAIHCSSDAIIPSWAYMLVSSYLAPLALEIQHGDLQDLEQAICNKTIAGLDISAYTDKPVIIKGCTTRPIPENAYVQLTKRVLPNAKSVMFGEACSSVPIAKKARS